jgi:hypothetical protein
MAKSVAKKVWRKPEMKVISAGSAEQGQLDVLDGQGQQRS